MGRMRRIALVGLMVGVSLTWSFRGLALVEEEPIPERRSHAPIAWVGAVMTNVVYLPFKLVYAGTGGLVGGIAYLMTGGDEKAFDAVWDAAGRGTYIVTPSMLEGTEPVHLVGPGSSSNPAPQN
jgi:hypothetical protein